MATSAQSPAGPPAAASAIPPPGFGSLAAQGRLSLAFIGLGLVWLAVAAGLTVLHADALAGAHAAPVVAALTHAWVLGFLVSAAAGALYQLAPVALGTSLWSERLGWWHLGLHAVGVPGMVLAFWTWRPAAIGWCGLPVAAGFGLLAINVWRTVQRSRSRDAVAWSLVLGTGWLVVTGLAGLTLAVNRTWLFWPAHLLPLLRAHAHLGLVGFFLTLLQGVTFRLVPMFTLADVPDWKAVRTGLALSQAGLVLLAPALVWSAPGMTFAAGCLIATGLIFSAWALHRTIATRRKRTLDPGVGAFARGGLGLGLAAAAGLLLAWPGSPWGSAPGGPGATFYGVLVVGGGLVPAFTGMLGKIVPFLTWMRAYGPRVGRLPTPSAGALTRPRLESWGLALQGLAILPLSAGTWRLDPTLLRLGAGLLAAAENRLRARPPRLRARGLDLRRAGGKAAARTRGGEAPGRFASARHDHAADLTGVKAQDRPISYSAQCRPAPPPPFPP